MIATGGTWDAADRHIYFLAATIDKHRFGSADHGYILLAANEIDLGNPRIAGLVEHYIEDKKAKVLLDSGIFWLTNEHKRAHGMTMNDALALHPNEIDGFDWLWDRYLAVVERFGERSWGYIELDQGGMDRKRETRAKLHDLGLRPIPVYHPLNDGWDYFDELAQGHDRICVGNIVQANAAIRKRLLATVWQRHRAYPHLWVHLLGLTPNTWLNSFPADSADSSTWLSSVRWDGYSEHAMLRAFSKMDKSFQYLIGSEPGSEEGHEKGTVMAAVGVHCAQRTWRHWQQRVQDELGVDLYPDLALDAPDG